MKYLLYIVFLFAAVSASAQRTARTVQDAVDAEYVTQEAYILSQQTAIIQARARFWQGLSTHSETPPHTTAQDNRTNPDDSVRTTTDQTFSWTGTMPTIVRSGSMLSDLVIDIWEGPRGFGYSVTLGFRFDGVEYRRRVGYIWDLARQEIDPDPANTEAWAILIDPEL